MTRMLIFFFVHNLHNTMNRLDDLDMVLRVNESVYCD
jgi:hypothetical protein